VKPIISIIPLALQKDGRTLKMAASFAKLGCKSIVIEHQKSTEDFSSLGIEVISLNQVRQEHDESENVFTTAQPGYIRRILEFAWHGLRKIGLGCINDWISFLEFKRKFRTEYNLINVDIPEADIYVFHSYEFAKFALSLKNEAKIIYDAHDFYQEINPINDESTLVKKWIMPFRWRFEKKLIDRCDVFLTVSSGLGKKYFNVSNKRPLVIKNAHDARNDQPCDKDIRKYLKLDSNAVIVCCVGNKKKGMAFDQLVKVFSQNLKSLHLVFIGNGYDYNANTFSNIHFIPALNLNKLVSFLKSANFGIVPYFDFSENYKFALPNGFFQLMTSQLPLIFSHALLEINQLNKKYSFGIAVDIKQGEEVILGLQQLESGYANFKKNIVKASKMLSWQAEEEKLKFILNKLV